MIMLGEDSLSKRRRKINDPPPAADSEKKADAEEKDLFNNNILLVERRGPNRILFGPGEVTSTKKWAPAGWFCEIRVKNSVLLRRVELSSSSPGSRRRRTIIEVKGRPEGEEEAESEEEEVMIDDEQVVTDYLLYRYCSINNEDLDGRYVLDVHRSARRSCAADIIVSRDLEESYNNSTRESSTSERTKKNNIFIDSDESSENDCYYYYTLFSGLFPHGFFLRKEDSEDSDHTSSSSFPGLFLFKDHPHLGIVGDWGELAENVSPKLLRGRYCNLNSNNSNINIINSNTNIINSDINRQVSSSKKLPTQENLFEINIRAGDSLSERGVNMLLQGLLLQLTKDDINVKRVVSDPDIARTFLRQVPLHRVSVQAIYENALRRLNNKNDDLYFFTPQDLNTSYDSLVSSDATKNRSLLLTDLVDSENCEVKKAGYKNSTSLSSARENDESDGSNLKSLPSNLNLNNTNNLNQYVDPCEGLFAKKSFRLGELISFYSGVRLSQAECDRRGWEWNANTVTLYKKEEKSSDPDSSSDDEVVIDVPPHLSLLSQYAATLGHKANHSSSSVDHSSSSTSNFFTASRLSSANAYYTLFRDHPRFGDCVCLRAKREIRAGEEILCDYGFTKEDAPEWWWMLEKQNNSPANNIT